MYRCLRPVSSINVTGHILKVSQVPHKSGSSKYVIKFLGQKVAFHKKIDLFCTTLHVDWDFKPKLKRNHHMGTFACTGRAVP